MHVHGRELGNLSVLQARAVTPCHALVRADEAETSNRLFSGGLDDSHKAVTVGGPLHPRLLGLGLASAAVAAEEEQEEQSKAQQAEYDADGDLGAFAETSGVCCRSPCTS